VDGRPAAPLLIFSDDDVLLGLLVLIGLFVLYEMIGVDPRFKHWHTISYYATKHRWLAFAIGCSFGAGGAVGIVWWIHHLGIGILK